MECRWVALLAVPLVLSGCVQPYSGPPIEAAGPPLSTQDQMAATEAQDRTNRFQRLASQYGSVQPYVEQVTLPPGSVDFMSGPVPVVRVTFPQRAFFAFDSAVPLPSSGPILDVIAENMKRDVPDAALTVLGHTDAIGSDPYNIGLSRRRAEAVMAALVARGVRPDQLSEVAIGKRQPIAPNDTADGRALNRRVEFLVSPAMSANLAAVQQRVVPQSFLQTSVEHDNTKLAALEPPPHYSHVATVYRLKPQNLSATGLGPETAGLSPLGDLPLDAPSPEPIKPFAVTKDTTTQQAISSVRLASLEPATPVHLLPIGGVSPAALDDKVNSPSY